MQHQGVRHFTTLRYDLEAARHPRESVDETTSETPRAILGFPNLTPPSSLAHHLEFQVVAFADIRTYYLETRLYRAP